MDTGRPVGQLLASLPPEERAERYRQFAAQAMIKATETANSDQRTEYLTMASGWHALAVESERALTQAQVNGGLTHNGEDIGPNGSG